MVHFFHKRSSYFIFSIFSLNLLLIAFLKPSLQKIYADNAAREVKEERQIKETREIKEVRRYNTPSVSPSPTPTFQPKIRNTAPAVTSDKRTAVSPLEQERTQWAFALTVSLAGLGGQIGATQSLQSTQGTEPVFSTELSAEYQPTAIQAYGVLGLGLKLAIYPIFNSSITNSITSISSFGGIAHYQLRYFNNQWLVPVLGASIENLGYQLDGGATGRFWLFSPSIGLWILDAFSTHDLRRGSSVLKKNYLFAEVRFFPGYGDTSLYIQGRSLHFGWRIEI